ncbi:MAG: hypothetical protein IJS09_10375, partial [Treponema sp.]|nr:hypothetical protein [Treponema sp.]
MDLYDGEAYDAPEQEFSVVLAPGVNQINEVLDKGENAPGEAWLRIFTLEPAGYEIQNLRVCSINQSKNYTQIIVFCLALMLLAGAIILLLTRNNNAYALVEVLTLNENVSLTIAQKWRGRITPALTIVILTACEWFFFRNVIGTESLIADRGDGRLTMLLTEHWYHVFRGEAGIADLGIFYPSRNTLGYSDIFFGFGIIHSVLRLLGVDVFFSYKYTLIIVHLIGTITTYLLLRRFLNVDAGWSLFGTIAFSFSSSYAAHSGHTQLLCISLVPPFFCALTAFFQNIHDRKKRNRFAALAIALMLLFLYTAWYIFFFTALFLVLLLCIESILFASKGYKVRHEILNFLKLLNADIVYYFAAFFIGTVPFIVLELPVLKMSGGRGYGEVRVYLPEVIDLINVDEGNWALGPLMKAMRLGERGYSGEVAIGFSLVLLLSFVVALIWFRKKIVLTGGTVEILTEGIALAVILSCVLPLRLSSNGVSLWWFVFNLFPGAASVRAAGRYLLYLSLPMAIITAVMGNELTKRSNNIAFKKISSCALLLLIFLAFVFNIRNDGV